MIDHGQFGPIEWAAASRPVGGEEVCGDQPVAVDVLGGGALFGVIDGLGHGAAAATAATSAAGVINRAAGEPLNVLIDLCHRQLATTRGVAMTLARIDFGAETMQWAGVGNVAANLLVRAPSGVESRAGARLAGGIVGYQIPDISPPENIPIRPGYLLVMASDGIAEGYLDGVDFTASAAMLAETILREHGRETDDALVLVARHRGLPT
ncbi:SpoIIE family protein phosphatase [Mycobacterium sp.]|uniref:SpoIIE family protein phosphatase n=1 Tax=Mycobacterium sp. TaxID=1785 RepID=UPI002D9E7F0D|nr:SpoIIE family protein phosphatase [Mycobacterium sp.]